VQAALRQLDAATCVDRASTAARHKDKTRDRHDGLPAVPDATRGGRASIMLGASCEGDTRDGGVSATLDVLLRGGRVAMAPRRLEVAVSIVVTVAGAPAASW
jgi:hypothetical protein